MTVGVVVPLYRSAVHVEKTLQSLLAQTHEDWLLAVVDDGSPDDSVAIAREVLAGDPRVTVIEQENAGVCAARNTGAAALDTDLLLFLDADDVLRPDALAVLCAGHRGAATTGTFTTIDGQGRPVPAGWHADQPPGLLTLEHIIEGPRLIPSATLWERAVFDRAGRWDEDFGQFWEDTHLALRVSAFGPIVRLPQVVVEWRIHSTQVSRQVALGRAQERAFRSFLQQEGARRPEVATAVRRYDRRTMPARQVREALRLVRSGALPQALKLLASAFVRVVLGPVWQR